STLTPTRETGVVYAKPWMVEVVLDLAGALPEKRWRRWWRWSPLPLCECSELAPPNDMSLKCSSQSPLLDFQGRSSVQRCGKLRHPHRISTPSLASFVIGGFVFMAASVLPSHAAEVRARALGPFSPYPGYTTASSGDVT